MGGWGRNRLNKEGRQIRFCSENLWTVSNLWLSIYFLTMTLDTTKMCMRVANGSKTFVFDLISQFTSLFLKAIKAPNVSLIQEQYTVNAHYSVEVQIIMPACWSSLAGEKIAHFLYWFCLFLVFFVFPRISQQLCDFTSTVRLLLPGRRMVPPSPSWAVF